MTVAAEEDMEHMSKMEAGKIKPLGDHIQVASEGSNRLMKLVSLMLLTPQYAVLILLMRYVRTRPGPKFVTSTTVLLAEVAKTVICLGIILVQKAGPRGCIAHLHEFLLGRPRDFLKVCVPSLLFVMQNNLVFVAISNLDAATFQVTYQLKILTTAIFSVFLLGKRLSKMQWVSLLLLFIGVSIIQVKTAITHSSSSTKQALFVEAKANSSQLTTPSKSVMAMASGAVSSAIKNMDQNHFTGVMAVLACCCLSGFANVFFELLLKGGKQSVWMRNIQLGLSGAVLGAVACALHDGGTLHNQGFFYGYDSLVWTVILLQSMGGLLVAAVIKYADNILKGFSTAGSILLSCLASAYLFDFKMDHIFMIGTSQVLLALYLYNVFPHVEPEKDNKELVVLPEANENSADR